MAFVVYFSNCFNSTHFNVVSNVNVLLSGSSLTITFKTASTIGTIIAVVAVFEIHIERNIVINIKPNISLKMKVK